MKHLLVILILVLFSNFCLLSQNRIALVDEKLIEKNHKSRVKTLDEFMLRFNGEELSPGVEEDSLCHYRNIASLFSRSLIEKQDSVSFLKAQSFFYKVVDHNVKISYTDSLWYAVADCRVNYKKKEIRLSLILKPDSVVSGVYRWSVIGVDGLQKNNLIDTTGWHSISPVEHEIGFVELIQFLNDYRSSAVGLRSFSNSIDQLSYFWGLIHEGNLKFTMCENIKFFFYSVPNYVFVVEEDNETESHSGWRINQLEYRNKRVEDPISDIINQL